MSIVSWCCCCRNTTSVDTAKPDIQQVHRSKTSIEKLNKEQSSQILLENKGDSNQSQTENPFLPSNGYSEQPAEVLRIREHSRNSEESTYLLRYTQEQNDTQTRKCSDYDSTTDYGLSPHQENPSNIKEVHTYTIDQEEVDHRPILYKEGNNSVPQNNYSRYLRDYSPVRKSNEMYRNTYDSNSVPTRINEDGEGYENYMRTKIISPSILLQAGHVGKQKSSFDSTCGTGMPISHASSSGQNCDYSHEVEVGTKVFTLLQSACKGDLNTLKRLFHDGTDMSIADYDGRRALHLSAAEGHLDCVKFLIETCNVPHSPRDRWYHTPLDEAKSFKKEDVVKYLEDYIFKTEEQERGAKTFMLLNSACKGDAKTLKRLYQDGVDMRIADYDGRTALHLAASEGHLDCVKFLVEQAEVPSCPKDRWFHTPVDEARTAKHDNIVEFLEEHNRKVNERNEGAAVFSILNSACKGDLNSLTKLAHDGVDMQTADYDGRTALHLAAAEGHGEVVKFLVEKCKVNPTPIDRWQHTPLDEAKNFKNETIVKFLERYIANTPQKVQKIFDPKMK